MKYILFLVFFLLGINSFAQRHRGNGEIKWLNISVKGGYGGTMLFNSDVMADGNVTQDFLSPSYEFGGRLGMTYGDYIGFGVEYLMGGFSQNYSISDGIVDSYSKTQKFTSSDIVVTLRYTNLYGFYFEAGPKMSTLKTASVENTGTANYRDGVQSDYKNNFEEKFTSVVVGLGYALHRGDRLRVYLGLRGAYALTDMVNSSASYYVLNDAVYQPSVSSSAKTSPFTLKLNLEINYTFGFWGDASCGRGRLMFFQ